MKKLLHKYNKCFTESEQKFLNEKSFETSNFYGLPKIHKSKVIETIFLIDKKHKGSRGQIVQQEDLVIFWKLHI